MPKKKKSKATAAAEAIDESNGDATASNGDSVKPVDGQFAMSSPASVPASTSETGTKKRSQKKQTSLLPAPLYICRNK